MDSQYWYSLADDYDKINDFQMGSACRDYARELERRESHEQELIQCK